MKEQSHKEEMSKALRGDFERLRDRGVATTLAPRDQSHAEADEVVDAPEEQQEPEREASPPVPEPELVAEPELEASRPPPEPEPVTEPATDTPDAEPDEPRSSWLSRMLGR